jgi:hypothetical protein
MHQNVERIEFEIGENSYVITHEPDSVFRISKQGDDHALSVFPASANEIKVR